MVPHITTPLISGVHEAALEVLIVGIFVIGIHRYAEVLDGLHIAARERIDAADESHSFRCRAIGRLRADRHVLYVHGLIQQSLELLVINRQVDIGITILNLETDFVILHGVEGRIPAGVSHLEPL